MSINLALMCMVSFALMAAVHAAPQGDAKAANPTVVLDTNLGKIKIELFRDKAPITVKNFLDYVEAKHYDGTIFHRVMGKENSDRDFMIQGGGFDKQMNQKKTRDPIKNESANGLSNLRGTIAMARTSDPDSATAQFFINVVDNSFLDKAKDPQGHGYCVFGRVIEGMDVVDKIKAVKTGVDSKTGMPNVPVEIVEIRSIRVEGK